MGKFIKYGRVVLLLAGRFAGKKAVVVKSHDEGNKERKFGHALVAGIERHPKKVTKKMSKKKISKRNNIKPFVKYVNLNHIMPTRFAISGELDLKEIVKEEKLQGAEKRTELKKLSKPILKVNI